MKTVKIDKKTIGEKDRVFVIVEIGSNYNQDFATAKKMIDIIKDSGADAVKFQIFQDKKLYPQNAGKVDYLKKDIQINALVEKAEVPDDMHKKIHEYCAKKNLTYLCTPTDILKVDYLETLNVDAYKIASYDLTNHYLLKYVAKKGRPIILSTGAGNFTEVSEAVDVIRDAGNEQIVLMQCVAQYPADYQYTNLKVIQTYQNTFKVPAGISDHSEDPFIIPYSAVGSGAKIIEKHFTLDRSQDGPDHAFAIEPDELKIMVEGIRKIEQAQGDGIRKSSEGENELRRFAYRSVFAKSDINKGKIITTLNSDVLRPGKKKPGINAKYYDLVLNSETIRDVKADTAIQWEDIIKKN